MKDIDFDELDRAVSSLMGSVPKTDSSLASDTSDSEKVITIPTSTTPAPPVPERKTAPEASSPASARRTGGRVMDVVHPSQEPKRPIPVTSRVGVSITPRVEALKSIEREPVVEQPTPSAGTSQPAWPDPIEMTDETQSSQVKQDTSAPGVELVSSLPPAPQTSPLVPMESPFLTDAKVEKRPLGSPIESDAVQDEDDDQHADIQKESTGFTSTEEAAGAADEPPVQPMVAELDSDLVAIESGDYSTNTSATPKDEKKDESKVDNVSLDHRISDHVTTQPVRTQLSASIPQQYEEKESSGDQSHAAIYDASAYAQPLSHPAKQKSGWLWIIWIVLLLALGAGAAVALYLLGII